MDKKDVRSVLNNKNTTFNSAVRVLLEFFKQPETKQKIFDYVYTKAKNTRGFSTTHMFSFYLEATRPVVDDTKLCRTPYASNALLRAVWQASQMQGTLMQNMQKENTSERSNQRAQRNADAQANAQAENKVETKVEKTKELNKEVKRTNKNKVNKNKETPEEKKERLRIQAKRMREAKAKKSGKAPEESVHKSTNKEHEESEKPNAEEVTKTNEKPEGKFIRPHKTHYNTSTPAQRVEKTDTQISEDSLSPQEKRELQMLRNMSN